MKKNSRIGERIKMFRERHYASQRALADALGLRQTVVSAWETGDNVPSCEAWVKLASLAPSPDNLWFLKQAGLDREIIIAAARTLKENAVIRPKEGEMVVIPRFRETKRGREEAGPPVRLEAEFVPNPLTTICLCVDEKSIAIMDAPKGLFILDTSCEGADDLSALWGHVIAIHYAPKLLEPFGHRQGTYIGRLQIDYDVGGFRLEGLIRYTGTLDMLTESRFRFLHVGSYTDPQGMKGLAEDDKEGESDRMGEIEKRAVSGLRLLEGVRVLGKVIGRLTGHLEVSDTKKAGVRE